MNKLILIFGTLLLSASVIAAPGGHGRGPGGHGRGAGGGRPAMSARPVRNAPAARPGGQRAARPAARPAPRNAARPAVHHGGSRPAAHHGGVRPAPRHTGYGYRPAHRPHHRHWMRPPMPPVMPLARYTWIWVDSPWTILVDGVYCSGDGYWFDGYNYYYNDCYYTAAPVSVSVSVGF